MKKKLLLIIILLTLFLSSCGILPITKNSGLGGTAWTLTSYNGTTLLSDTTMTAFIEDKEVNGSAGCNHYFGSFKAKGDQIQIDGLAWTEMACMDPEGIMQQEQQVMSLFSKAVTFSIQGQVLQIITGSGEVMEFQQIENREY